MRRWGMPDTLKELRRKVIHEGHEEEGDLGAESAERRRSGGRIDDCRVAIVEGGWEEGEKFEG